MSKVDETLGRCPFCGGSALVVAYLYSSDGQQDAKMRYRAMCGACGSGGPGCCDEESAAEAWNRRKGAGHADE